MSASIRVSLGYVGRRPFRTLASSCFCPAHPDSGQTCLLCYQPAPWQGRPLPHTRTPNCSAPWGELPLENQGEVPFPSLLCCYCHCHGHRVGLGAAKGGNGPCPLVGTSTVFSDTHTLPPSLSGTLPKLPQPQPAGPSNSTSSPLSCQPVRVGTAHPLQSSSSQGL